MTQEEFARLLNTSKQVISRYESGQRSPKVSVVGDYATRLGVSISDLTGGAPASSDAALHDPAESELIGIYRGLNRNGQGILLNTARGLAANPDMKKTAVS